MLTGAGEPIINVEIDGGDEALTAARLSPALASAETIAHSATRGMLTLPVAGGVAAVRPKTPDFGISGAYDPLPTAEEPDAPVPPKWVQPQGAHDGYAVGAIVRHGESRWVSLAPANVGQPGVSGWREVVEEGQVAAGAQPPVAHDAYPSGAMADDLDRVWENTGSDAEAMLPAPDAAGEPVPYGAQVSIAPDGRLTLVDPPLAVRARDDADGRELHSELLKALDRLIDAVRTSNQLAHWRESAEEAKERLGSGPTEVRISAILRIERLRSLLKADERRRADPDPLIQPAEARYRAELDNAVKAANLYVATDPLLAGQQRLLGDPGIEIAISIQEAEAAAAEMDDLDIADPALLAELRLGRETAAAGGRAGERALAWLAGSWRNVVREMLRQVLAWVREQAKAARTDPSGIITVEHARTVLASMGVYARRATTGVLKAGGQSAGRIWRHGEPILGKGLAGGIMLFLADHVGLLTRLGWSPDFAVQIQRLLAGITG